MSKLVSGKFYLDGNLHMGLRTDGKYWLYDKTRGMNLAMAAKTQEDAFVECIKYYQERLNEVEITLDRVQSRVDAFVESFTNTEDY